MEKVSRDWKFTVGIVAVAVAIFLVGFFIGDSEMKSKVITKEKTYSEYVKDIEVFKDEASLLKEETSSLKDEKASLETELKEAVALIKDKDSIQSDIDSLTVDLEKKQTEIAEIDVTIKGKKDELDKLNGDIVKAIAEPVTLGAGIYIVGKDIPEGRYKVEPLGAGSNFFVFNGWGEAHVNVILGNDSSWGQIPSYIFLTSDGDEIETRESVKLTKVE